MSSAGIGRFVSFRQTKTEKMMCGGTNPATDADENVQAICDKVSS